MKPVVLTAALSVALAAGKAQPANSARPPQQQDSLPVTALQKAGTGQSILAYDSLVGSRALTRRGVLTLYTVEGHQYLELPDSLLQRSWLVVNRVTESYAGSGYSADDQVGEEKLIRFTRGSDQEIELQVLRFDVTAGDSSSAMHKAVSQSNQQPVVSSFPVKALSPAGYPLIEITEWLAGGEPLFAGAAKGGGDLRVGSRSLELFAVRQLPPPTRNGARQNSDGEQPPIRVSTSFLLLPAESLPARRLDPRVGYNTIKQTNFSFDRAAKEELLVRRWRLQPRPQDMDRYLRGQLVEPAEPIIVYIDPATPAQWMPYLEQSVNDWQQAFEKAGFKNAIMARRAPAGDTGWSLQSCRAAIVYKTSGNGQDQPICDPRSGEIIQCHINWYHTILGQLHDLYMVQAGPNDPSARHMQFSNELMGRLIRTACTRYVGYALGLTDNAFASTTVPIQNLRNASWLRTHGHSPSIMDDALFNFVAQPEDGVSPDRLLARIGDYDRWAIEWGYRWWPATVSADSLAAWTAGHRELRYGYTAGNQREPADNAIQLFDMGNDALSAGSYGIANLQRVMKGLLQWTREPASDFSNLQKGYRSILGSNDNGEPDGQFARCLLPVVRLVGGVRPLPPLVDGDSLSFFVPAATQQAAVEFLHQQLFQTPRWLLSPEIFSRTGENPLFLLGGLQSNVLKTLLGKDLQNLFFQEAVQGADGYTATRLLRDLQKGIWQELATGQPIDIYRRRLQNLYIATLANPLKSTEPSDLQGIVAQHLRDLREELKKARSQDPATTYHLEGIITKIDAALQP